MARRFNGSTDYLLADSNGPTVTTQFTTEFWFRSDSDAQREILGAASDGSNQALMISTNLNVSTATPGYLRHFIRASGGNARVTNANVPDLYDGEWHHVLWERDGSTVRLFIDSVQRTTSDSTTTLAGTALTPGYPYVVGGWNNRGTVAGFLPGDLSRLRMWQRLLTTGEKGRRAIGMELDSLTGLVLDYRMATAAGTEVDQSPTENDATASGTTLTDDPDLSYSVTAPSWASFDDLDLWLTARDSPLSDEDAVSYILDHSGEDNHVVATTGPATYREDGTAALNDRPTIQTDTDSGFHGGDALKYGGKSGLTVVWAGDVPSDLSNFGNIIGRDEPDDVGWRLAIHSDGRPGFYVSTGPETIANRMGDDVNLQRMPAVLVGRYDGTAGELSLFVNGVLENGTLTGTVPATIAEDGPDLRLFRRVEAASPLPSHTGDLAVFGRALTDEELAEVHAELLTRYDLVGLTLIEEAPALAGQGVAADNGHRYTLDHGAGSTHTITKRDQDWDQVAQNGDATSGLGDINTLNDGGYHDGKLYVALTNPSTPTFRMGIYDADDLSRISADVPLDNTGFPTGLTVDPTRGIIWGASFGPDPGDATSVTKYDLATHAFLGSLTLSEPVPPMQGISYNPADDQLWISCNTNANQVRQIFRVDPGTGKVRRTYRRQAGYAQGLDVGQGNLLYWAFNNGSGAANRPVRVYGISGGAIVAGPGKPSIVAEADSPTDALLVPTLGAESVSWELRQDGVLIASGTTAELPAFWIIPDLTPTQTYLWVLRGINAEGSRDSDPAVLTMPGAGVPPIVRVDEITQTTARYTIDSHPVEPEVPEGVEPGPEPDEEPPDYPLPPSDPTEFDPPAGMTLIGANDGSVLGGIAGTGSEGSPAFGISGFNNWFEVSSTCRNNGYPALGISHPNDATNPSGSGKAIRIHVSESGCGAVARMLPIPSSPYSEMYFRFSLYPEIERPGNIKLFYLATQNISGVSGDAYFSLMNHGGFYMTVGGSQYKLQNIFPVGAWNTVEVHAVAESVGGATDGEYHVYLNGEHVRTWSNVKWSAKAGPGDPHLFNKMQWYGHHSNRGYEVIYRIGSLLIAGVAP